MHRMESRLGSPGPGRLRGGLWPRWWTVKTKMVVTASIPLLLLIPVVSLLIWSAAQSAYSKILISKVQSDMELAQQIFRQIQQERYHDLQAWAESANLYNILAQTKGQLPQATLSGRAKQLGLDYLRFINKDGQVVSSVEDAPKVTLDPTQLRDLETRTPGASVNLLDHDELLSISPALSDRVLQPIVPTRSATPDGRTLENRAMVIQLLSPVYLNGDLLGYLDGGILLNHDLKLVDNLNDTIYPPGALLDGSIGTATLFLQDVRVATTVRANEKGRALGTRVSDVVRQRVLGRGEVWLERAYVVNNWYMAAYAPITNSTGARIGMLYVGFLEQPYADLKTHVVVLFLLAVLLAMLVGAWMVNRLAGGIFYPLRRMNHIMSRQEKGDSAARVGNLHREDEFAELASHFDSLLDQLEVRRNQLESLNRDLDRRVHERTEDLQQANQRLHQAIEQLLASEKLAVMGQLTAGIAHEFNNPLAVMMGHLDLLRLTLGSEEGQKEVRQIDEQIQRLKNIVQKLLQFCRPDEFASYTTSIDVHDVIQDSLLFAKSDLERAHAGLNFQYGASRLVQISRTELQQIMVNLLINASHAIESFNSKHGKTLGSVWLRTRDVVLPDGEDAVCIEVENNAEPLAPEQLNLIFKMFYTTKQVGKGTGLGLPVSRMLIQRFGGDLRVQSPTIAAQDGFDARGVRFDVIIRCTARPSAEILRESGQRAQEIEKQLLEGSRSA